MKKTIIFSSLVSICFILISLIFGHDLIITSVFAFTQPFSTIGQLLRDLSLLQGIYNALAIIAYILISIVPLYFMGFLLWKKKTIKIDFIFLPILSIMLFGLLYVMINWNIIIEMLPSLLRANTGDILEQVVNIFKFGLAVTFDALILLYLFIRYFIIKTTPIHLLIDAILIMLIFVILQSVFLIELSSLLNSLSINNYDNVHLILTYLLNVASSVIVVILLIYFYKLSRQLSIIDMSEKLIEDTKKILKLSVISVIIIFAGLLTTNIYQIIFSGSLQDIRFVLNIPIFELTITMVMMLISEYMIRTYEVHEENALTI